MNKYYELTWKCFPQQNAEKIVPLLHTVCECEPVFSLKQFTLDQKCASNAHGLTAKCWDCSKHRYETRDVINPSQHIPMITGCSQAFFPLLTDITLFFSSKKEYDNPWIWLQSWGENVENRLDLYYACKWWCMGLSTIELTFWQTYM